MTCIFAFINFLLHLRFVAFLNFIIIITIIITITKISFLVHTCVWRAILWFVFTLLMCCRSSIIFTVCMWFMQKSSSMTMNGNLLRMRCCVGWQAMKTSGVFVDRGRNSIHLVYVGTYITNRVMKRYTIFAMATCFFIIFRVVIMMTC